MKINKLFICLSLLLVLAVSCKKEHYDLNHVHGIDAEGELLLPIASTSFTMMDMMERFQMDSLIDCAEDGQLSIDYYYEQENVIKGDDILRFKDFSYNQYYTYENTLSPSTLDTVFTFDQIVEFDADHISVKEAVVKSGRFDFGFRTNIGALSRIVIRSSDIKDALGNDWVVDMPVVGHSFGFDLEGLHYLPRQANSLRLTFEAYFNYHYTSDPELFVDVAVASNNLAFSKIRGHVDSYEMRSWIDTTFSLFPDNLSGILEMKGVELRVSERNTFGMEARMVVDSAWVVSDGVAPYDVLEPLPLSIDIPSQAAFNEVFKQTINGKLNLGGGRVYASSNFILNPKGITEEVTVVDTSTVDVRVDVNVPFDFVVDDVTYIDTVEMQLSDIQMPDLIKELTLQLTFKSTIPINLTGSVCAYDSANELITDTLVPETKLIVASFDGQPSVSTLDIDITDERLDKVLHSDRIIMLYALDTEARDVKLNANQKLELFVKAKVKYDAEVEFDK